MSSDGDKAGVLFLVVGVGNPLRGDDGVGPYVADRIEARHLKGVRVWVTQQLHVEDLEPMLAFKKVFLVDASLAGPAVFMRQVLPGNQAGLASSHHLSPEVFVKLSKDLYHKAMDLQVCSIRGVDFEAGDNISPDVLERAQKAVDLISVAIKEG